MVRTVVPNHVWQYIVSFVDPRDHLQVRAVNKAFAGALPEFETVQLQVRTWRLIRGKNNKSVIFKESKARVFAPNYMRCEGVARVARGLWPLLPLDSMGLVVLCGDGSVVPGGTQDPVHASLTRGAADFCFVPVLPGEGAEQTVLKLLRVRGFYDPCMVNQAATVGELLRKASVSSVAESPAGPPCHMDVTVPTQPVLYAVC